MRMYIGNSLPFQPFFSDPADDPSGCHILDFTGSLFTDPVIQSAGAEALADHRMGAVGHITDLAQALSYSLSGSLRRYTLVPGSMNEDP